MKREAYAVFHGNSLAYDAFKAIGYRVLETRSAEKINTLFGVLKVKLPLEAGMELVPHSQAFQKYTSHLNPNTG